jgi:hypothetical protein
MVSFIWNFSLVSDSYDIMDESGLLWDIFQPLEIQLVRQPLAKTSETNLSVLQTPLITCGKKEVITVICLWHIRKTIKELYLSISNPHNFLSRPCQLGQVLLWNDGIEYSPSNLLLWYRVSPGQSFPCNSGNGQFTFIFKGHILCDEPSSTIISQNFPT